MLPMMDPKLPSLQTLHSPRDTWNIWPKNISRSTVLENSCTWSPLARADTKLNISTSSNKEPMNNDHEFLFKSFTFSSMSEKRINFYLWVLIFRAIFFDKLRKNESEDPKNERLTYRTHVYIRNWFQFYLFS